MLSNCTLFPRKDRCVCFRPRQLETAVSVRNSLLEGVFRQASTLLENSCQIFRQRDVLSLPRFAHFSGEENGCWKIGPAFGNAPGFSSSKTTTAFLSFSDSPQKRIHHINPNASRCELVRSVPHWDESKLGRDDASADGCGNFLANLAGRQEDT